MHIQFHKERMNCTLTVSKQQTEEGTVHQKNYEEENKKKRRWMLINKSLAYNSQGNHTEQLTGRWQQEGIMWLALSSIRSIKVKFLNQIHNFPIYTDPIVLAGRGGPSSTCNPILKLWKCHAHDINLLRDVDRQLFLVVTIR